MLDKINVLDIIRDHLATLKRYGAARPSIGDLMLFFGVPLVPAVLLPWQQVFLSKDSVSVLITALAIFGALLFNLLILVYDVSERAIRDEPDRQRLRRSLLKEIHSNVAFSVLLTIISIILLMPAALVPADRVLHPTSSVTYYLGSLFILTQLMVLRRVHLLIRRDISAADTLDGASR